jgi:hypothetical protein
VTVGTNHVTLLYFSPCCIFAILPQDTIDKIQLLDPWTMVKLKNIVWVVDLAILTTHLFLICLKLRVLIHYIYYSKQRYNISMKFEAFDYDLDERHALLLQRIDDMTSEIYSIGAYEERKAIFDHLRELIHAKDIAGDIIAVEVLAWAMDQIASEG